MGLEQLLGRIPAGGSRSLLGTVVTDGGVRKVNVGGNVITGTWADPMVVDDGDVVNVRIDGRGVGAKASFSSRTTDQPRPRTGTVTATPAGSPTITVTANNIAYTTEPVNFSPVVGDKVHLDWGAGSPRSFGKVTTATVARPPVSEPVAPPPTKLTSGRVVATAKGSRTYWAPGGWGSYAGDGNKVHQGSWGGATVTGAWFYGTPFKVLDGRKITRITFRTGARIRIGNYGLPVDFHFHAHTNAVQPSGDTNRVVGPHTRSVAAGAGPMTIDLPLSFAATLVNGGGIAIQGEPYAGMLGMTSTTPDSGTLTLYWEG